ncbi:MAG: hypothetical protein Q7S00_00205 [bacterium]|nr:hypothetical protein [bacterium]
MEILSSPSLEEARRRLRAGKDTLYGWLRDPVFKAELKRQQEGMVSHAYERLKTGMAQAVDKVIEILHKGEDQGIQLKAAQILLEHGGKVLEFQEMGQRLEVLEEKVFEKNRELGLGR